MTQWTVGNSYVCRNGQSVKLIEFDDNPNDAYKLRFLDKDGKEFWLKQNGQLWFNPRDSSPWDILEDES